MLWFRSFISHYRYTPLSSFITLDTAAIDTLGPIESILLPRRRKIHPILISNRTGREGY